MWFPIWHRSSGSHRAASVHCLHGARAADIKTPLMFLAGNLQIFSNSPLPTRGTNDVRLSAVITGAASSACFTKPWKKWASKPKPKWEWRLLAAGSFFFFFSRITDCLHVVPTTNWTSRICQKHSCSPPTHSEGWTWTLITHHFCSNRVFVGFRRPPTRESLLVSIATGLVPPSSDVLSSPPAL